MKKNLVISIVFLLLAGCSRQQLTKAVEPSVPTISVTDWTERTELFLEHPPLVAGQTSRFAVHLTRLDNFKPVTAGTVEVRLEKQGAAAQSFSVGQPSQPGIFGVDVRPAQAGAYTMMVRLRSDALSDAHDLGVVEVYREVAAAAAQGQKAPQEETIAFLKEQQWSLDFATELVRERGLRTGLRVPAEVRPRTGGEAEVTVPFNARLVASALPALGTPVENGQVVAQLLPPTQSPADLAALELARTEAEVALELARKDRERAERLLEAGAIPARRLDEARAAEATAEARLQSAQARLAQYENTRRGDGESQGSRLFLLRAPIAGVIAETHASPGTNVEAGENLFKIVDTKTVYVAGNVPEAELPRLRQLTSAELEAPGGGLLPAGRLISVGHIVDPASRTVSVVYEVNNRDGRLAVGQAVFLRLFTSAGAPAPAVPEPAIVDDAGRPVVFVQRGGEAFARRPVTLGNHESGYVQVLEGLRPGERVVTRGAYLIRLASLSTQIPAHGHVH